MSRRVAVIVLFLAICAAPPLHAIELDAKCTERAEHNSVMFFLVDRSDKVDHEHNLKSTFTAVSEMVEPGERLVVGLSAGAVSDARVVLDLVRPKKSLWVSALKLRAQENTFKGCLESLRLKLVETEEEHSRSAILETLSFVSKVLASEQSENKRVVLYSDMIQNSPALSFYSMKDVNPDAALGLAEKAQLVWNFKGASVYVAGAGTHSSDAKARQIENFWQKYFEKTGAQLKFYGPLLLAGS